MDDGLDVNWLLLSSERSSVQFSIVRNVETGRSFSDCLRVKSQLGDPNISRQDFTGKLQS